MLDAARRLILDGCGAHFGTGGTPVFGHASGKSQGAICTAHGFWRFGNLVPLVEQVVLDDLCNRYVAGVVDKILHRTLVLMRAFRRGSGFRAPLLKVLAQAHSWAQSDHSVPRLSLTLLVLERSLIQIRDDCVA